jgi:hypothetical protein
MAKKQTRRSISVSRTTYEKLKSFCETNNISMSQFVETRVGDFLGGDVQVSVPVSNPGPAPRPQPLQATQAMRDSHSSSHAPRAERPMPTSAPARDMPRAVSPSQVASTSPAAAAPAQVPMTSAAARYAVEPPPPIIKPRADQPAPKPAEKRPDQIFTF